MNYQPLSSLIELNQYIIKESFVDSTYIEVPFYRKDIISVKVYKQLINNNNIKEYEQIELAWKVREIYNNNELVEKFIILETTKPITGYVVVL